MGKYGVYVLNQSVRIPVRKFKMKDAKLYLKIELENITKKIETYYIHYKKSLS